MTFWLKLHVVRRCPGHSVGCRESTVNFIPDELSCHLRGEVHTSDRSPHLIVCGRLLLKNEMVKCAGTQEFRCVQAASHLRVFQWSQVERGLSRIREFHEVLWLLMLVGGLVAIFYFPINIGNVIIPIDSYFSEGWPWPTNQNGYGSKFWYTKIAETHGCLRPQWKNRRSASNQVHSEQSRLSGVRIPAPWRIFGRMFVMLSL